MCDEIHNEALRERLREALAALEEGAGVDADERATVALDQQSVGRLSRMDAMQRQAMAQAAERRRHGLRRRIEAALARMEEGEFGYCVECGDKIPRARLEADPTVALCLACARG